MRAQGNTCVGSGPETQSHEPAVHGVRTGFLAPVGCKGRTTEARARGQTQSSHKCHLPFAEQGPPVHLQGQDLFSQMK